MPTLHTVPNTCIPVEYLILGPLDNNIYMLSDGAATMVVDPTCEPETILEALGERTLGAIVLTHSHNDHIGAAAALREATGALVIASEPDAPRIEAPKKVGITPVATPCKVDHVVQDGDILKIGNMPWKVIFTPGHTPGSMCLYIDPSFCPNPSAAPLLISGDTLFFGTVGRTDLEGGNMDQMRASIMRLAFLPDETIVLPGHGNTTTIGDERTRVFAQFGEE